MVDAGRLRDTCLELVSIPSPTGDTSAVTERFGELLTDIGMTVELVRDFPGTPTLVGRLAGRGAGPRLVLCGHLDTVPIAHDPPRVENGRVYGRGSADMKGALSCAAEVVRMLKATGDQFPGELVIVAIGLHEAPSGRGEDLVHLLRDLGFQADGAIVCELGGGGKLPVAHMGSATFEITVSRPGVPTHELQTAAGTPHPLLAAGRVMHAIATRSMRLAAVEHPLVGAETYFVGEVHGGDFYNRFPSSCRLVGTRRWAPTTSFQAVEEDFRRVLSGTARETGCRVDLELRKVRDSYRIDPSHPLVRALQAGYLEACGEPLELVGSKIVADGAIWTAEGIPAVYYGPAGSGAHADVEYVQVDEMVRATRVYLSTVRHYWRDA